MQRTIIKDGIVVNVVEIDSDTQVVTKERHYALQAAEDAAYQERLSVWRTILKEHKDVLDGSLEKLAMARMMLSATKASAAGEINELRAAKALKTILALEDDVKAHELAVQMDARKEVPDKPKLVRGKRWIKPEDCEIGPEGGQIGDFWDGEKYVQPEKIKAA